MADRTSDQSRAAVVQSVFSELLEFQDRHFVLCAALLGELKRLEAERDGSTGHALRLCEILHERLEDTEELLACQHVVENEA